MVLKNNIKKTLSSFLDDQSVLIQFKHFDMKTEVFNSSFYLGDLSDE